MGILTFLVGLVAVIGFASFVVYVKEIKK